MSAKHDPEFLDWFNQASLTPEVRMWPLYAVGRTRIGYNETQSPNWMDKRRAHIHAARRINLGSHWTFVTTPLRELPMRMQHARTDTLFSVKPKSSREH
jgi:hypothetical protein